MGSVWGLLSGGPLPAWRPWWLGGDAMNNARDIAVVIDPGHGGGDTGAVAHGMAEKTLNLDVGQRVAQALRAQGVGVHLTREDDHFISLGERVRQANALPGAIFVSIHFNDASGDGKTASRASGIETFYSDNKETVPPGWVMDLVVRRVEARRGRRRAGRRGLCARDRRWPTRSRVR